MRAAAARAQTCLEPQGGVGWPGVTTRGALGGGVAGGPQTLPGGESSDGDMDGALAGQGDLPRLRARSARPLPSRSTPYVVVWPRAMGVSRAESRDMTGSVRLPVGRSGQPTWRCSLLGA